MLHRLPSWAHRALTLGAILIAVGLATAGAWQFAQDMMGKSAHTHTRSPTH